MDLLNTLACSAMIAGISGITLYVTIADIKRRSKMTRQERRAEDWFEANHKL